MVEPSWQPVLHPGSHYEPRGTGLNNRPARPAPGTAPLQITLRITGPCPTRARSGGRSGIATATRGQSDGPTDLGRSRQRPWPMIPDKDEAGGSSPPRPATQTLSTGRQASTTAAQIPYSGATYSTAAW